MNNLVHISILSIANGKEHCLGIYTAFSINMRISKNKHPIVTCYVAVTSNRHVSPEWPASRCHGLGAGGVRWNLRRAVLSDLTDFSR